MSDGSGSSVKIVGILAIVVLVGVAVWFFGGRSRNSAPPTASQTTSQQADDDVHVKVDLPDTITIK